MLSLLLAAVLAQPQEPAVFPRPQRLDLLSGTPFEIKKGITVLCRESSPAMHHLTDLLARCTGEKPRVVKSEVGLRGLPVVTVQKSSDLGAEDYRLFAQANDMVFSYGGDAGLFYAVQTLRQLLPDEIESPALAKGTKWTVPAVRVADRPRFSWRGMHLDVSRHFFPVTFIKRYIDYIAMNKMNVFHWHLVDDGGWRMEVKKYPLLTAVGSVRAGTGEGWSYSDIRFLYNDEKPRYGGYYSQEQIREIVKYAADKYVTIVPEIEMPGHTSPSITVYPDLGCDGVAPASEKGRTNTNVYCAGKESTFTFLEDVLTETMDLFPSKWIHIGGDEVDKGYWNNCPQCQKRMKDEDLKDSNELQSYFVKRIEKFLVAHGRRLIGWDEILEGGLAPEATVMSWRGIEGGIAAAQAGHDVVMSPTSHCYFDYSYASTSTQKVYGWEPVPDALGPIEAKHVLGGQANVWTEWIPTVERAEYMIFPRMLATAEVLWTGKARRDWDSFNGRLARAFNRLDLMGANYFIPGPDVDFSAAVFQTSTTISARAPQGTPFTLRYSMDGKDPGAQSPAYTGPISVAESATVAFAFVSKKGNTGDVVRVQCIKASPGTADGLVDGLDFAVYEGAWQKVPDFSTLKPAKTGSATQVGLEQRTRDDEFAVRFTGYLNVAQDGVYTFRVGSDDGSVLKIAGATVIDNDGLHGYNEKDGAVRLGKGVYPIEIAMFESGGAERLTFQMMPPGGAWSAAPAGAFLRKPQ